MKLDDIILALLKRENVSKNSLFCAWLTSQKLLGESWLFLLNNSSNFDDEFFLGEEKIPRIFRDFLSNGASSALHYKGPNHTKRVPSLSSLQVQLEIVVKQHIHPRQQAQFRSKSCFVVYSFDFEMISHLFFSISRCFEWRKNSRKWRVFCLLFVVSFVCPAMIMLCNSSTWKIKLWLFKLNFRSC